jgi:hypothetical protein
MQVQPTLPPIVRSPSTVTLMLQPRETRLLAMLHRICATDASQQLFQTQVLHQYGEVDVGLIHYLAVKK